MNNYKLKHLSRFCCKPANETEFEAVKMAAELGGVGVCDDMTEFSGLRIHFKLDENNKIADYVGYSGNYEEILVIDFIKKLRMTEEEAQALEDDRVVFDIGENWAYIDGSKAIEAFDGHHFRVSEDGKTVTLHRNEQ